MNLKRLILTAPIVLLLTVAGFEMNPIAQSGSVQTADTIVRSAALVPVEPAPPLEPEPTVTPTTTPTTIPTLTPVPTFTPQPSATRNPNLRSARVPILMYHYISVPPPDADIYRLDLSVTPDNFSAQMDYLAAEGYHPIRVSDFADYLLTGKPLPSKPIVLTFDDGYLDNYENALPVLVKHKFPATFFIITQFAEDKRPGYMNWDQVEQLAIEGMEIGSHTVNHRELNSRSLAYLETEIAGSKAMIESRIGTPVKSFCYPASKYDARTIEVLRSDSYLAATTEISGAYQATSSIYELRRIRVRGSYSVNDFAYWLKYWLASGK
jgi:peptidoglycan/xylan/chitin deacetylase (PgdA/CDA1 family)